MLNILVGSLGFVFDVLGSSCPYTEYLPKENVRRGDHPCGTIGSVFSL